MKKMKEDIEKQAPPLTSEAALPTFMELYKKRHKTFKRGWLMYSVNSMGATNLTTRLKSAAGLFLVATSMTTSTICGITCHYSMVLIPQPSSTKIARAIRSGIFMCVFHWL
jgi:hypothetical protein